MAGIVLKFQTSYYIFMLVCFRLVLLPQSHRRGPESSVSGNLARWQRFQLRAPGSVIGGTGSAQVIFIILFSNFGSGSP